MQCGQLIRMLIQYLGACTESFKSNTLRKGIKIWVQVWPWCKCGANGWPIQKFHRPSSKHKCGVICQTTNNNKQAKTEILKLKSTSCSVLDARHRLRRDIWRKDKTNCQYQWIYRCLWFGKARSLPQPLEIHPDGGLFQFTQCDIVNIISVISASHPGTRENLERMLFFMYSNLAK